LTKILTLKPYVCILIIFAFCGIGRAFAQQQLADPTIITPPKDSVKIQEPYNIQQSNNMRLRQGLFDADPPNLVRTIVYDAATNQYILYESVGNMLYRAPQYLTYMQYLAIKKKKTRVSL